MACGQNEQSSIGFAEKAPQTTKGGSLRREGHNSAMTSILKENQEKIAAICQRLGVERLDVFGSAVRNDFDSTVSDLNFVGFRGAICHTA